MYRYAEHRAAAVAINQALKAASAAAAAAEDPAPAAAADAAESAEEGGISAEVLVRRVCDAITASGGVVDYVEVGIIKVQLEKASDPAWCDPTLKPPNKR
jgi:hypothetical protein